nr:uncharacterized protein LOC123763033 isoform X2 [Procambarus clarkii]
MRLPACVLLVTLLVGLGRPMSVKRPLFNPGLTQLEDLHDEGPRETQGTTVKDDDTSISKTYIEDDDYYPEDGEYYDDGEYYENDEYPEEGVFTEESTSPEEPDEARLWLSDDDPDWTPEGSGNTQTSYDETLLQIAQLMHSGAKILLDEDAPARDKTVEQLLATIKSRNLGEAEARNIRDQLLILAGENNLDLNDISEEKEDFSSLETSYGAQSLGKVSSTKIRRHVHQTQNEGLRQISEPQSEQSSQLQQVKGGQVLQIGQNGDATLLNDDSGYGSPGQQVDTSELSQGVEQLVPEGGQHRAEVGVGVEPEEDTGAEDSDRPSLLGWLQKGWRHVTGAVDNLGDQAEDTLSEWGDKITGAAGTVHVAAAQAVDKVQETAKSARELLQDAWGVVRARALTTLQQTGEKIATAFQKAREALPHLQAGILAAFAKFGTLVQEGAHYCLQRLTTAYDQVRGSEILDKLEQKMTEGNEQVATFFRTLGQKVSTWQQEHTVENVDEGLVVHHHHQQEGQDNDEAEVAHIEEGIPDFFQDDVIKQQLLKLVDVGVLTQSDLEVFYQEEQKAKEEEQKAKEEEQKTKEQQLRDAQEEEEVGKP